MAETLRKSYTAYTILSRTKRRKKYSNPAFITYNILQKFMSEIKKRTRYVNFIAVSTLVASLILLLFSRGLGGNFFGLQLPEQLIGIILLGSGFMLLIENAFDKEMDLKDADGLQFIIGVPGSIVAIMLGLGYLLLEPTIVTLFGGFEGGIYLAAIVIIAVERLTNMANWNPRLKDFKN